jgi:hypothetical protein
MAKIKDDSLLPLSLPSSSRQLGVRRQRVRNEPGDAAFAEHGKAVSPSYARKLASDFATALQVQQPPRFRFPRTRKSPSWLPFKDV